MSHTVSHIRDHYDVVFEELAASARLENGAQVHVDIDRNRSIRVYPKNALTMAKLRDAVKVEAEVSGQPSLIVIEGLNFKTTSRQDFADLKELAGELAAEVWLSISSKKEQIAQLPASVERVEDLVSVVLALEPGEDTVLLRALKDHDNPDLSNLHVALDPKTLLLTRH
jgi:antitoxin component of MazEF toxin-antitoxin module